MRNRSRPEPAERTPAEAREAALKLLARREHARQELFWKLVQRGYAEEVVAAELDRLAAERLLSDERFAEAFTRSRTERGQGPRRIRAELQQRGVAEQLIEAALDDVGTDWFALARQVARRRFGTAPATDWQERGRRSRYLEQRGFTHDQIRFALEDGE